MRQVVPGSTLDRLGQTLLVLGRHQIRPILLVLPVGQDRPWSAQQMYFAESMVAMLAGFTPLSSRALA